MKILNNRGRRTTLNPKPTLLALAIIQCATAQAATIHVGGALGRGCGLSAAILSANLDVSHPGSRCIAGDGDDTIELHRDVIIRRSWKTGSGNAQVDTRTGMPLIESNITINGNNHSVSRATTAPAFRLFRSAPYTTFSINEVSLRNGKGSRGGAVFAGGDLNLNNSSIADNELAIVVSNGSVSVIDSNFSNNTVGDPRVSPSSLSFETYNAEDLYIKNSRFENNTGGTTIGVYGRDAGYNFLPDMEATIVDSTISGNAGKGITFYGAREVSIRNTKIIGNSGRGLSLAQSMTRIEDSVVSENSDRECAGISNYLFQANRRPNGDLYILNSSVSNNTATEANGGGVCLLRGEEVTSLSVTIKNSTVAGNSASGNGGGIFSGQYRPVSPITLINSTVSGNRADGSGGGIYLYAPPNTSNSFGGADLRLFNSTIANNSAVIDGGGIEARGAALDFRNSIISANAASGSGAQISTLTPADYGPYYYFPTPRSENNLLGDATMSNTGAFSGFFTPSDSDITATSDGTTPTQIESIILPLANNGGLTLTHALTVNSPAVNAGNNIECEQRFVNSLDQRGEARDDGLCDIGAYEFRASSSDLPVISVRDVRVVESEASAILQIELSEPQNDRITVDFQTVDGTANDGIDYQGRSGSMTFAPGQTQKIRAIQLINDDLAEDQESFDLVLSNPVGAELQDSVGTVEIIDDDGEPLINIEPILTSVSEGTRAISYQVTLSSPQTEKVSVDFQTLDLSATAGLDYVARSGSMTFAIGQTRKVRRVELLQDDIQEPEERFRFVLSNPRGAILGANSALDGVIIDDD